MAIVDKILKKYMFYAMNLFIWVMTISILIQIISRFVFNSPLSWTEEIARVVQVWLVFVGTAYLFEKNDHIVVDFLSEYLSLKMKKIIGSIVHVLIIIFLIIVTYYGFILMSNSMNVPLTSIKFSVGWVYLAIPVHSLIMLYYAITNWKKYHQQGY